MPSSRAFRQGRGPMQVSSMTSTKLRTSSTSSQKIRNNFLWKIGVSQKPENVISVSERSARDIRDMPRLNEPLQYDRQEERLREEQRQFFQAGSPSSVAYDSPLHEPESVKKKQVQFRETVTAVLIPESVEYSSRVQAKLFHDSIELSVNLAKNLVEFNAENRDWFDVCLEDKMYVCGHTGELIHPVHMQPNQYACGSPNDSPQPYSLSQEHSRYLLK